MNAIDFTRVLLNDLENDAATIDTVLQPLPAGRYRVQLGVTQDGEDWFASGGPGAAFVMVVS